MDPITNTRDAAYQELQSKPIALSASRIKIYNAIKESKDGLTNSEIGYILGIPINRITGRVFELREMNLIKDNGIRICNITKHKCHYWKDNHGITNSSGS